MDPKAIALIRVVDDDRAVSKAIQFLLENEDWTVQVFPVAKSFLSMKHLLFRGALFWMSRWVEYQA